MVKIEGLIKSLWLAETGRCLLSARPTTHVMLGQTDTTSARMIDGMLRRRC